MNPQVFTLLRNYKFPAVAFLLLITGKGYAQLGPGGVSNDLPNSVSPTQSDVRLWLDAGSLTNLADGDDVSQWDDISPSTVNDRAFRQSNDNFLPPYFRDDPSATINGYPVLTFEDGRMLKVNSSNDLNTSIQTTYEQTIVFAFRTSEDINSRQVIWEEGGGWRGINIFIFDGQVYLGAYDKQPDNDPGPGGVAPFGYSYVRTPIQPNTTYVLSHIFSAPTDNSLNGYIQGYQNGSFFGTLETGGQYSAGIGGVYRHPDPIGIGAVNSDSFMETGPIGNQTGSRAFKGRLAEICYYNRLLNSAERIIVENYLGAKYYANIIVNDRYEHQAGYGKGVIGIGQTSNNSSSRHTVSKGINIFEISPVNEGASFNAPNEFLLVGNNGSSLNFTEDNTPNDPGSTMRTERIWRFDESGETSNVKFRFYPGDLPALPSGFTKYVLIFDESSPNFPNFSTTNSNVVEVVSTGGGFYEAELNVQDNAFMTIGAIKPQVSFRDAESFALESNPGQDSTVFVNKIYARLNYVPETSVTVDLEYTDGTATRATDYGYMNSDVANGITFPPGFQEVPIRIWVKNDVLAEDPGTENVLINLVDGPNTTAGVGIGAQSQHVFTIYDDDPPPKLSFAQGISAELENGGSYGVQIVRTGSTSGSASARVRVISTGTTATANDDYSYPSYKTVSFSPGESVDSVSIDIVDDIIDEVNENIRLQLYYISGAGTDASSILFHDVEILDDDLPPTVEFTSSSSQNFETNGTPRILIELDQPSSKEVTINYTKLENLSTSASYGSDYTLTFPGSVVIQAGDTLAEPENLIIMQDGVDEDDETIEFQITSAVNANLGTNLDHVYTIKDYSTFEWKGAGGIGKDSDNVFWIEADRQSGSHNSSLQTLTNFSPQNINISQSSGSQRARLQTTSNLINGKKTLRFDGSNDHYTIENSGLINLAPSVSKKAYFMTIRTGGNVTNWQTIYKQGGGSRGIAIYIRNGSMYFHAWNNPNDGPESPWGAGSGPTRYARFDGIQANTNYVVSCMFDKDATQKLRIYVNGQLGQRTETNSCGLLYTHSGAVSLGGNDGSSLYHDGSSSNGRYFNGFIAEVLHFTDAPVTETRRRILENYFAKKYNITLSSGQTVTLGTGYDRGVAGIGQLNSSAGEVHIDSQGKSILRIKSPAAISNNSFLVWGHNDRPLDEIWPWSNSYLPEGILERSGMVWNFDRVGNVSGVEVLINYNTLANANAFSQGDLKLLIHNNSDGQDFTGATSYDASALMSGNVVKFENVTFTDGSYMSLANSSSINPLPIELISFDALKENDDVRIVWKTATELNNDYFVVERAGPNMEFKEIDRILGAGNSNSILDYNTLDRDPLAGVSYYRLKQVDFNGDYEYSDPVSVYFSEKEKNLEFSLFPNPVANGMVKIQKFGDKQLNHDLKIDLVDLQGKIIHTQLFQRESVIKEFTIPSHTGKGVYLVNLHNSDVSESFKLVVN